MVAIGLYDVTKTFRRYDCRNRWLRRDVIDLLCRKRREVERWTVLDSINIEIETSETVAIMGRNGSGKSTLLKLMAGILRPSAGSVTRRGSMCTLMELGAGFHEDLTGRENVLINGTILGLSEKYLQFILPEIEYFAELEGFLDTPLKYYSMGMRARLGFAVAMSADPDVFLIDEVLAVGDEGFRQKCFGRLDELISRSKTIVIVSHDTDTMRRLASRGIWIESGVIRADGPIRQVCDRYMDYYADLAVRHLSPLVGACSDCLADEGSEV
jgi:ABC-type polysaccharide/polyol phosphate transport system ATPase subunit